MRYARWAYCPMAVNALCQAGLLPSTTNGVPSISGHAPWVYIDALWQAGELPHGCSCSVPGGLAALY